MLTKKTKRITTFLILLVFVVTLMIVLSIFPPEEIVAYVGVQNGYILAAIVSFFGGFSSGGSISFMSLLIVFASGGLNPWALGIISGISLALGDIIMFSLGTAGRTLITGKWDARITKLKTLYEQKPFLKTYTPLFAYLYMGFTPFPNDLLLAALAAIEFPAQKMRPIIILGDLTFACLLALLAAKGLAPSF